MTARGATDDEIAEALGNGRNANMVRLRRRVAFGAKQPHWTPEELKILCEEYENHERGSEATAQRCLARLPGRTLEAIRSQAKRQELTS